MIAVAKEVLMRIRSILIFFSLMAIFGTESNENGSNNNHNTTNSFISFPSTLSIFLSHKLLTPSDSNYKSRTARSSTLNWYC